MNLQSLKLLRPTVEEELQLQKIHYVSFDFDLGGVKVTRNIAQYPLHHVTYTPAKFEVLSPTVYLIYKKRDRRTDSCKIPKTSPETHLVKQIRPHK